MGSYNKNFHPLYARTYLLLLIEDKQGSHLKSLLSHLRSHSGSSNSESSLMNTHATSVAANYILLT